MDALIQKAISQLGEKEVQGKDSHNPTIIQYAQEAGFTWVNDDETPWCSIFVNWVAKSCQLKCSNKANARSWLTIGKNVDANPEPGDIVIFWRESKLSWKGHVGFFFGYSHDVKRVYCLGGNQGNQVSISAYPSETVLGFRRLVSSSITVLPEPILKINDKGNRVKLLQTALNSAGINCGTSDGDFGPKTEAAVSMLQSMSGNLTIDGIYSVETQQYLQSLLTE
ncbi:hypothetical protein GCM10011506_34720 [Marivirga lumbricoides]|uniref:TIGR02594 family protein n=1 Tax=Marivirga lumbricoides TaxID=1046115 RepID=A0ABQ1MSZ4_9BACT|nr:hypothetical protein GCM10011506_34720 [Marivirga lumbricoides]